MIILSYATFWMWGEPSSQARLAVPPSLKLGVEVGRCCKHRNGFFDSPFSELLEPLFTGAGAKRLACSSSLARGNPARRHASARLSCSSWREFSSALRDHGMLLSSPDGLDHRTDAGSW